MCHICRCNFIQALDRLGCGVELLVASFFLPEVSARVAHFFFFAFLFLFCFFFLAACLFRSAFKRSLASAS